MSPVGPAARYYEDLDVGEVFTTPARTITEADVALFAGLSGDYNPLHTDAAYAQQTPFGERIAHGLLGMAVLSGLVSRLGIFDGTVVAFLGIEEWRFTGPILFGETVHVEVEIDRKRDTRDPARGIVWRRMRLVSASGDVLQEGVFVLMMRTRAGVGDGEDTDD